MLRLNRQDGKTVDLSEIVDVRLEFDDPSLCLVRNSDRRHVMPRRVLVQFSDATDYYLQGGRSTLLNFQFTDNKNNIVYRLSADEEGSAISDFETTTCGNDDDSSSQSNGTHVMQQPSTSADTLVGSDCAHRIPFQSPIVC